MVEAGHETLVRTGVVPRGRRDVEVGLRHSVVLGRGEGQRGVIDFHTHGGLHVFLAAHVELLEGYLAGLDLLLLTLHRDLDARVLRASDSALSISLGVLLVGKIRRHVIRSFRDDQGIICFGVSPLADDAIQRSHIVILA